MTQNGSVSTPQISVAISTRGRAQMLPRLIGALERQSLPRDRVEVVVVDDGSDDGTLEVLHRLQHDTTIELRALRLEKPQGPAAGRNRAWRACRAHVVAFTDDDCQPAPDWLERGLDAMETGNAIVVGHTIPNPDQMNLAGPFSPNLPMGDVDHLPTCNVFYRRDDLEAVNGFDERFPTPGGEDTDLGWRVEQQRGREVLFREDVVVMHDIGRSDFLAKVKYTLRWIGMPRLVSLYPVRARSLLYAHVFWKDSHPRVILAVIGIVLSIATPFALVLTLPWLYMRVRRQPLTWHRIRRFFVLPGAFVIDLLEVAVMVRGSIKYRTFVL